MNYYTTQIKLIKICGALKDINHIIEECEFYNKTWENKVKPKGKT